MAAKNKGCGCLLFLIVALGIFVFGPWSRHQPPADPAPSATGGNAARKPKPPEPIPKVVAELSKFTIDRAGLGEGGDFVFTVHLTNQDSKENTVYAVVYGKNDMFSPPRREAWPAGGILFRLAGTSRGALSPSDITRNWNSDSDSDLVEQFKEIAGDVRLKPGESDSFEGALPINETSLHEAWKGQRLDPRSMFNEVYLWVFSDDGRLIC